MAFSENASFVLPKEECVYTKCYCEENVWKLCDHVRRTLVDKLASCYCVFISNPKRMVPLWCQKASNSGDGFVGWDYHVIMLHQSADGCDVYDLDTTLPFPCDFNTYTTKALKPNKKYNADFIRYYRVIPAAEYLSTFASDRSHMLDKDGKYQSPPPEYPCIRTEDATNNIQDFIDMTHGKGCGKVLNDAELIQMFRSPLKKS